MGYLLVGPYPQWFLWETKQFYWIGWSILPILKLPYYLNDIFFSLLDTFIKGLHIFFVFFWYKMQKFIKRDKLKKKSKRPKKPLLSSEEGNPNKTYKRIQSLTCWNENPSHHSEEPFSNEHTPAKKKTWVIKTMSKSPGCKHWDTIT